jgi:hypothetical protein
MQLIGNAMLIEYTKINKKGITRMQLLITFGPKDLAFAVWDILQLLHVHRAHNKVGGTNCLKERR